MPIVIPSDARDLIAHTVFGNAPVIGEPLEVGLFVNNYVPVLATVFANLTEATFPGYARNSSERGDTTFANNGLARQSLISGASITWTSTGGEESAYGWFLLDSGTGRLLAVERFAAAIDMTAGHILTLTPVVDVGALLVGA
jgi:hypothetical protein